MKVFKGDEVVWNTCCVGRIGGESTESTDAARAGAMDITEGMDNDKRTEGRKS